METDELRATNQDTTEAQRVVLRQKKGIFRHVLQVSAVLGLVAAPSVALSFSKPVANFAPDDPVIAKDFNELFDDIYSSLNELDEKSIDRIDESATWTVGADGDFASLSEALQAADSVRISAGAVLTIQLLQGTHALAQQLHIEHPDGARLHVVGDKEDPASVQLSCPDEGSCLGASEGQSLGLLEGVSLQVGSTGYGITLGGGFMLARDVLIQGGDGGVLAELGGTFHGQSIAIEGGAVGAVVATGSRVLAQTWVIKDVTETGIKVGSGSVLRLVGQNQVINPGFAGIDARGGSAVSLEGEDLANEDRQFVVEGGQYGIHIAGASSFSGKGLHCKQGGTCIAVTEMGRAFASQLKCENATRCAEARQGSHLVLQSRIEVDGHGAGSFFLEHGAQIVLKGWIWGDGKEVWTLAEGVDYTLGNHGSPEFLQVP